VVVVVIGGGWHWQNNKAKQVLLEEAKTSWYIYIELVNDYVASNNNCELFND
jgi:hypothetical protein